MKMIFLLLVIVVTGLQMYYYYVANALLIIAAINNDGAQPDEFIKAIEEAIEKSGKINRKLAHSMFVGPPGSGKSSLIQRLLGRMCKKFSESTGVCDSIIFVDFEEINPAHFHSATILDSDKWEEIDYELSILKQMGQENIEYPADSGSSAEKVEGHIGPQVDHSKDKETVVLKKPSSRRKQKFAPRMSSGKPPFQAKLSKSSKEKATIVIAVPKKSIQSLVAKYGYHAFKNYLKRTCSLYLRDTGGQVEFQEMLPLLIFGPSIFFFVFRVDLDFTEKFIVNYRTSSNKYVNAYTSSITTEEALLQCLASVYAMGTADMECIKTHKPLVFIVGTHKDNLGASATKKLRDLNSYIESLVIQNGFQDLVEYADEQTNQIMFTVDNTSHEETDFQLIRSKVNVLVSCRTEFAIQYPISYLLFCLDLQNVKANILTLSEFKLLAQEHGIEGSQVFHLLRFLHIRVGVIRYYDVEGLKDIVVIQPQVLFNTITDLVLKTFSCRALTSSERREFKKKGVLSLSAFENVINESEATKGILPASAITSAVRGDNKISPQKFLRLLVHLRIITPFVTPNQKEEKYFIPCVLNHVPESRGDSSETDILPLAVKFQCDHCPKGLFGVLVTHLMTPDSVYEGNHDVMFTLIQDKLFKDQVSLTVTINGFDDEISLKAHPSYLELKFFPDPSDERELLIENVCNIIRSIFEKSICRALDNLHYSIEKTKPILCLKCKYCFELHSVRKGGKFHRMQCDKFGNRRLPQEGRCWYNEGM